MFLIDMLTSPEVVERFMAFANYTIAIPTLTPQVTELSIPENMTETGVDNYLKNGFKRMDLKMIYKVWNLDVLIEDYYS